jgi:rhodanese-related sulfurtransferase
MKKPLNLIAFLLMGAALFALAPAKIAPAAAKDLLAKDSSAVLVDVRTAEEFQAGHIKDARLLPYDAIDAASAKALIKDKDSTVVVYCRSGRRSAIAAETLAKLGYTRVLDLGGVQSWPYGLVTGKD